MAKLRGPAQHNYVGPIVELNTTSPPVVAFSLPQSDFDEGVWWYIFNTLYDPEGSPYNVWDFQQNQVVTPKILFQFPAIADNNNRVLINNHWKAYGSPYPEPTRQTQDGKIEIEAKVTGIENAGGEEVPLPNTTIYLRVKDPEDDSNYLPPTRPHENDNQGGLATIASTVTTDANAIVKTTLTLPSGAGGGDNYIVEGSINNQFSCNTNCPKSGTLTAWKRAFVEHTLMFRSGQFIVADVPAGSSIVKVSDATEFKKVGNQLTSVLIFSADNPGGESRKVKSVNTRTTPHSITLDKPLNNAYKGTTDLTCGPAGDPNCAKHPYGFVGNERNGYYDLFPDSGSLSRAFNDAYVEWTIVRLPDLSYNAYRIPSWFNILPGGTVAQKKQFILDRTGYYFKNPGITNTIQLVGGGRFEVDSTPLANKLFGIAWWDQNSSWGFLDRITLEYGSSWFNAMQTVTAHELGHQWNVNASASNSHDSEEAAQPDCIGGADLCLMNPNRNRSLGVQRFHCVESYIWDMYCIRGHIDDLNQSTCNWVFQ